MKVYCSILSLSRMYIVLGQTIGELGLIFKHANIQSQVGNIPRAQYALHEENEFERNNMCIEHTLIKRTFFNKSSPFGLYY